MVWQDIVVKYFLIFIRLHECSRIIINLLYFKGKILWQK